MAVSTIWFNIIIGLAAAILTGIIVVLIRRPLLKQGDFMGVLWLIGIFAFWGSWECASVMAHKFSYTIIKIDNGRRYSKIHVLGSKDNRWLENRPNFDIEFERTYIDNCSDRHVEIQSIEYGRPQIGFHVNRLNTVDQLIISHSSAECKVILDYFFESPNSITIKKKKFSSSSEKVIKRILVYMGDDN